MEVGFIGQERHHQAYFITVMAAGYTAALDQGISY
jgi:hypothetical protein